MICVGRKKVHKKKMKEKNSKREVKEKKNRRKSVKKYQVMWRSVGLIRAKLEG